MEAMFLVFLGSLGGLELQVLPSPSAELRGRVGHVGCLLLPLQ